MVFTSALLWPKIWDLFRQSVIRVVPSSEEEIARQPLYHKTLIGYRGADDVDFVSGTVRACALLAIGSGMDMRLWRIGIIDIFFASCCCEQTLDYESHLPIMERKTYIVTGGSSFTCLVRLFQ